jgi:hypothetical protein
VRYATIQSCGTGWRTNPRTGGAWSNIQSSTSAKDSDRIAEGDQVRLHYKNRQLFVIVVNVVASQERYEGRVQGFADAPPTFEINGLKAGCIVGFCHDDIWRVE